VWLLVSSFGQPGGRQYPSGVASDRLAPGSAERRLVEQARVARLATVRRDGSPHLVVVTFALVGDAVVTAVDEKPKSTRALQRLANIEHQPSVSLLVDHYDEDWSRLRWVRLDGTAEVVRDERRSDLVAPLVAKYPQYQREPPLGPVVVIDVRRVVAWSASASTAPP
jgi:PPOX class probable F420-dependent enzyme